MTSTNLQTEYVTSFLFFMQKSKALIPSLLFVFIISFMNWKSYSLCSNFMPVAATSTAH